MAGTLEQVMTVSALAVLCFLAGTRLGLAIAIKRSSRKRKSKIEDVMRTINKTGRGE